MNIRPAAILWDMDGTIIDTEPAWIKAEQQLLARYNAELRAEDALDWVGIGLWDLAQIFRSRGVLLSSDQIVAELTCLVNEEIFAGELSWRPGARELIAGFKSIGIPNALVTMATREQAKRIVGELPEGSFATVTAGDDVPNPKPHPDPYLLGAATLGFDASNCVAIEDSITGVRSAATAGTFVIGVPNLVDLKGAGCSILVESLEDVTANDIVEMFQKEVAAKSTENF